MVRRAVAVAGLAVLGVAACQATAPGIAPRATPVTASRTPAGATPTPAGATPRPTRPAGNQPGTWHLVLQDTFTGSALNTAVWSTGWLAHGITPPVSSGELECYDPANVTVSGGALHLSLIQHPHSCGGKARPYSSGMVNTDGKFQFTYGFMEARIWLPGKGGQITDWPAFWADGQHWPKDGEIDVLEGLGGRACWHFINRDAVRGGCAAGTFYGGWHTFGADWEPRSITYYYDGRVVGTIKSGITHAPMYLILNNATAHLYQIPVQVPADMRVAYVRVWQHPQQRSAR
jgi:beta-glucanase (GH16 family)